MKEPWAHYLDLVVQTASVDHVIREGIEHYKARLLLADGSRLRVSEVWIDAQLVKYSYYWLDESDRLIAGWDNAPHHPETKTHPHHIHTVQGVHDSPIRNLEDVLNWLRERILGG